MISQFLKSVKNMGHDVGGFEQAFKEEEIKTRIFAQGYK
jgi:hypothetical protein